MARKKSTRCKEGCSVLAHLGVRLIQDCRTDTRPPLSWQLAHDFSCPSVPTSHSSYVRIEPVHHGGWPGGLPTTFCSLQEAQQEAYYNVGPFGGDMPNATTNRWYPDLGQNMQGT